MSHILQAPHSRGTDRPDVPGDGESLVPAGLNGYIALWRRLRTKPQSINHRIFRAVFLISGITALAKVATAGKELFIADRFGRGDAIDAFLIAFAVPAVLVNVISASLSAAFIPTYIQVRESRGELAARNLLETVIICSQVTLLLLSLVLAVFAPQYLPLIANGFSHEKLELASRLARHLSPFVFINGLVTLWTAVLNSGGRFAFAAATPVVTPALTIGLLIVKPSWGVEALTVGTVVGIAIEAALLTEALRRQKVWIWPHWHGFDRDVRAIGGQYAPMLASSFLMASTVLVDQAMAGLLGPGSIAALNYGSKITGLLTTLGATSLSTAVLPYFSLMVARAEWKKLLGTLRLCTALVLVVTVPIAAILFRTSMLVVRTLFQHGEFTAADTSVVAEVQGILVLQLPFYAVGILGVRLISSLQKNQILTIVSLVNLVMHVVLNWLFMHHFGVAGIALSTTTVYFISCAFVYIAIIRKLRECLHASNVSLSCSDRREVRINCPPPNDKSREHGRQAAF